MRLEASLLVRKLDLRVDQLVPLELAQDLNLGKRVRVASKGAPACCRDSSLLENPV